MKFIGAIRLVLRRKLEISNDDNIKADYKSFMGLNEYRSDVKGIFQRCLSLIFGITCISCSKQKNPNHPSTKHSERSERKPKIEAEITSRRKDQNHNVVLLKEDDLRSLPDTIDTIGANVDEDLLLSLGVPQNQLASWSSLLRDKYSEARSIRERDTKTLKFTVDQKVEISSMSEQTINDTINRFHEGISALITGQESEQHEALQSVETLLKRQLKMDFGTPLSATLTHTEFVSSKSAAHTPSEFRNMIFNIERKLPDGKIEKFSLDPVQSPTSRYFFLSVKRE